MKWLSIMAQVLKFLIYHKPYGKIYHFYENIYFILTYLNRNSQFFYIYLEYNRIFLKQNFRVSLGIFLISTLDKYFQYFLNDSV